MNRKTKKKRVTKEIEPEDENSIFSQMDIDEEINEGLSELDKEESSKKEANTVGNKKKSKSNIRDIAKKNGIKKKRKRKYVPCKLSTNKIKRILSMIHTLDPDKSHKKYNREANKHGVKMSEFTLSGKYGEDLLQHQMDKMTGIIKMACEVTLIRNRVTLSKDDVLRGHTLYKNYFH